MGKTKRKELPALNSDEEAIDFVENSDLTQFDLSALKTVHFEFEPKTTKVNMRFPESLLAMIKERAAKRGIPYQRFIRETLERALTKA